MTPPHTSDWRRMPAFDRALIFATATLVPTGTAFRLYALWAWGV